MPCCHFSNEFVGHKNLRPVRVEVAIRVHHTIEGEQNRLADKYAMGKRIRNAVTHQTVALCQDVLLRNPEAVQIYSKPPVVPEPG